MDEKSKEQPPKELSGLFDFLPYPIAIFTPQYTLAIVNKAFTAETKIRFTNLEKENARILQYKIDDGRLTAAVLKVFNGDTFFLEDVKKPFSMFSGISKQDTLHPERFKRVVVFPVPADDDEITHGVIVFMP
ncbi:MAG: hypothetical protein PHP29_09170 [Tissierellia bacterium]|nr:hypothetical protein [Tissierellia bacterium]